MEWHSVENIEQCKVVAENEKYGAIVQVQTVYLTLVRVSLSEHKSGRNLLKVFTKAGAVKGGCIHRGNLLIGDAQVAPAAVLEQEMKAAGFSVTKFPRGEAKARILLEKGYQPYLKTESGYVVHPLGLAWAKLVASSPAG